jgi:hypothetical protein
MVLNIFSTSAPLTIAASALQQGNATPIWVPLLIAGLILLLFWWGLTRGRVYDENFPRVNEPVQAHGGLDSHQGEHTGPETRVTHVEDLQQIEGIGPKIAVILAENGITTFAELAKTDIAVLRQILREAGLNLAAPETWPEQASLAAAGQWAAFEELKESLQGGKRV